MLLTALRRSPEKFTHGREEGLDSRQMRRFHLWLGALLFVVFVLTGQYMDKVHAHLVGMPDGPRMLYRTRHIFILLTALLHLGIGAYVTARATRLLRACQWIGSALIALAGCFFIAGFFLEPLRQDLHVPLSSLGAFAALAGVALHVSSGRSEKTR